MMNNYMANDRKIYDVSLYTRLGGENELKKFVERLYFYMETLPEVQEVHQLHAMSLTEAGTRLFRFLSGMLGGPPLFHQHYGEPRLRRRHMHIAIGDSERDQWMLCAKQAAADMDWTEAIKSELLQRLDEMANHLRNQAPANNICSRTV